MISSAITNCTVPVIRGSSHGPIATPCSTRARVSVRNVMMAAPATAPVNEVRPADHQHREQRERDREVELVGVERDHALGPQRSGRAHHRRAEQPHAVAGAHDVRADRRRRERVFACRSQSQPRPGFLVDATHQHERDRSDRRDADRRADGDTGEPERSSRERRRVLEERVHDDQERQRRHRHRRFGHADDRAAEDRRDDERRQRRERDRRARAPRWSSRPRRAGRGVGRP